jgi:hypothetical protein
VGWQLGSLLHWLNLKNCCVPEIGFVTIFNPLTTTGTGKTLVQTGGETRLLLDCKKDVPPVGHVKTTFKPDGAMANCGGATANDRLNTVPDFQFPPNSVVP